MKRLMLATTAALTLSAPAFAQSQTELAVSNALAPYGYEASDIAKLSGAQIAELYLALTSEDGMDILQVIDGMELAVDAVDNGLVDTARMNDSEVIADRALVQAGFPEGTVNMLSADEVALLYITATGEDPNEIATVIDGLQFGMEDMAGEEINSQAERYVVATLLNRGIDRDAVLSLTDAEFAELYIVLTSGDESDVNRVLDGVLS